MPQIFHPSMNAIARGSLYGALVLLIAAVVIAAQVVRSPYANSVDVIKPQPVPFSHRHHVGDDGMDCRYCHQTVETSSFAGMPPTQTCMNCHSRLWSDAESLEAVRESYRTGTPIAWTRVHDVPDYAYFNHSIHVAKGVACRTCHGAVEEMPLMWREATLQMEWCLGCHRDPASHIGPRDEVYLTQRDIDERGDPPPDDDLLAEVRQRTDCSTCHR